MNTSDTALVSQKNLGHYEDLELLSNIISWIPRIRHPASRVCSEISAAIETENLNQKG